MNSVSSLISTHSADATCELGAALGRALATSSADQPIFIALNGELGAGKTTFVGGLLRALGVTGPVRSPTYTLIETYDLPQMHGRHIHHLDLYRLADASELEMLAPRDLLEPGAVLLVEWAERGGRTLPSPDLSITLLYPQGTAIELVSDRCIEVQAGSTVGKMLAASLHPMPNQTPLSP
jgi:tRNA threonylcarbamoyladenosine biosynthesis protein TsaE